MPLENAMEDKDLNANNDITAFIRENLILEPVPGMEDILVYRAQPESRLSRLSMLAGRQDRPPYWAYVWSGGLALAQYLRQFPQTVQGRRVLDIGSGSGLVGIVAAKEGAQTVLCADIDPNACAAIRLNADANRVAVEIIPQDLFQNTVPQADIVLMGDVFYNADVAAPALSFAKACRTAGLDVLVGDPGRENLPHSNLQLLEGYVVSEFGMTRGQQCTHSSVFRFV